MVDLRKQNQSYLTELDAAEKDSKRKERQLEEASEGLQQ